MWELRDHRYGGRTKRYKEFPQGLLRGVDPLTKRPVAFANELQFENWLLYWANPQVRELIVSPGRYACLDQGRAISIKPHLLVKWVDRKKPDEIQIVTSILKKSRIDAVPNIQKIACANNLSWSLRTRTDIRSNSILLENLLHFRQCLAITSDDMLADKVYSVLKVIEARAVYRRDDLYMDTRQTCCTETELDAILFILSRAGRIKFPIESEFFNRNTNITL